MAKMEMQPGEIKRSFLGAKNRREQLQILAERNCCTKGEIVEILLQQGVPETDIPKQPGRKKQTGKQPEEPKLPKMVREIIMAKMVELQEGIDGAKDAIKQNEEQITELGDFLKRMEG